MKQFFVVMIVCIILIVFAIPSPTEAFGYLVDSSADIPDGDVSDNTCDTASPGTECTLRAAVMQANAHAGPDTITVPAGTYILTRVGADDTAALGDLDITDDVFIASSGGTAILDANSLVTSDRVFEVLNGTLTLDGFTIQNGSGVSTGGGISAPTGSLSLSNLIVQNNQSIVAGGGIYAAGPSVRIDFEYYSREYTSGPGGGISISGNGVIFPQLDISNSTIRNNQANGFIGVGGGMAFSAGSGSVSQYNYSKQYGLLFKVEGFGIPPRTRGSIFNFRMRTSLGTTAAQRQAVYI